jgi:radical SAM superfamily enzyme YgiQ (UPF0313 family)
MSRMRALLISTYELGRQPFGLASPAAWLRARGWDVACADLAKEPLSDDLVRTADLVGVHLQMHTATRLAGPVIARVRALNPAARVCAYGLYAPLNETWLRSVGVSAVFGGEFEGELTEWAEERRLNPDQAQPATQRESASAATIRTVPRLQFLVPDRRGLPPLARYATLTMPDGATHVVGSTEASRGCRHLCRHCPIVPVYDGQFRVVPPEVVLADIEQQVAAGATHITFGDPDFFNGPTHALRIVEALHAAHPQVTYDVTIKVEHLLQHAQHLPELARTGCAFVTTAVEAVDDRILERLDKGHTRADFGRVVEACRSAGLVLNPTFVAFTPWTTLEGYRDLLETIERLDLIEHVAPIQLAIRLLIPSGSRLLELDETRDLVGRFDPDALVFPWRHSDPRVDQLQIQAETLIAQLLREGAGRAATFARVSALAARAAGAADPAVDAVSFRSPPVPYLSEPWYC